jgi:hypothetical protein
VVSHTDSVGRGIYGSADAPKAMPIRCGTNSMRQKPPSGQKWSSIFRRRLTKRHPNPSRFVNRKVSTMSPNSCPIMSPVYTGLCERTAFRLSTRSKPRRPGRGVRTALGSPFSLCCLVLSSRRGAREPSVLDAPKAHRNALTQTVRQAKPAGQRGPDLKLPRTSERQQGRAPPVSAVVGKWWGQHPPRSRQPLKTPAFPAISNRR